MMAKVLTEADEPERHHALDEPDNAVEGQLSELAGRECRADIKGDGDKRHDQCDGGFLGRPGGAGG